MCDPNSQKRVPRFQPCNKVDHPAGCGVAISLGGGGAGREGGGGYWGGQVGGGTSTNLEFDESDEPDHDVEPDDVEDCVPLLSPLDEEGDEGEARRRLL